MKKIVVGATMLLLLAACTSNQPHTRPAKPTPTHPDYTRPAKPEVNPGFTRPVSTKQVHYTCDGALALNVVYQPEVAIVTLPDGQRLELPQQPSASGTLYSTGKQTLHVKGGNASWGIGRAVPVSCRVTATPR